MMHTLLMLMFVFSAAAGSSEEYWSLRKASLSLHESGRDHEAEIYIRRAIESAEKMNDEYAVAVAYSALGNIEQAQLRFVEAERAYEKSISILMRHPERNRALAIVWRNLASALTAEMRYDDAAAVLDKASKLLSRNPDEDPQLRALILNAYGVVQLYQGKINKAERSFLRASQFRFRPQNPRDLDLSDVLNNLGRVYQTKHEYTKAEDAYKRSLQLISERLGPTHPNLSTPLDNVGSLYRETGRYQEAESHLRRSLAIEEEAANTRDEAALMHTLYELGMTYFQQNDRAQAEAMLARASMLARKRTLPREMAEACEILERYSAVLKQQAKPAEAQSQHAEAQRIRATFAFTVSLRGIK